MAAPTRPNERWSIDFMSDQLASGRRFRILNVAAGFSRMCVGQLVAAPVTGARLALFLDELGKAPKAVVCDNGPESASKAMRFWSERSGAALNFIQPGKPTQNAFVESFNGKFRDSCLKATGSGASPTSGASWTTRGATATMNGRTVLWATRLPPNARRNLPEMPFHSLSNWTCFRGRVNGGVANIKRNPASRCVILCGITLGSGPHAMKGERHGGPPSRAPRETGVAAAPVESPVGRIAPGRVAPGRVAPGRVAAQCFTWQGLQGGGPMIEAIVNWFMGSSGFDRPRIFGERGPLRGGSAWRPFHERRLHRHAPALGGRRPQAQRGHRSCSARGWPR